MTESVFKYYEIHYFDKEEGWKPLERHYRTKDLYGHTASAPLIFMGHNPPETRAKWLAMNIYYVNSYRIVEVEQPPDGYPHECVNIEYKSGGGQRLQARLTQGDEKARQTAEAQDFDPAAYKPPTSVPQWARKKPGHT